MSRCLGYIDHLLAAFPSMDTGPTQKVKAVSHQTDMAEPLSEREMEVLRLLQSSLSSNEIADELYVSVNTIRSHMKSIYGKLGAHSRYEAIARAKELKLF